MGDELVEGVPRKAYLAADAAFNSLEWSAGRDELSDALAAASPHIRIDELDKVIQELHERAGNIPVLGAKNNGARSALDEVIQLLTERKVAWESYEQRAGRTA